MGQRGARATPIAVKLAKGTLRKRDGDPSALATYLPADVTTPPDELGEIGRKRWAEVVSQLDAACVLTQPDLCAIAMYCRTFDEVADIDALLAKVGRYQTSSHGLESLHPAVTERFRWLDLQRKYALDFGMTPTSRNNVQRVEAKASGIKPRRKA